MSYQSEQKCDICKTNSVGGSVIDFSGDLSQLFSKDKRCKHCGEVVSPCSSCMDEPCPHCDGELVLKSESFPDNIFKAVKEGNIDKVRAIAEHEYCELTSLENENGLTLLTLAVFNHNLEMCKFLINEMNVGVCYQSRKYGRTSLIEMMQARSSNTSVKIMDLLRYSVQYQDNSGKTALMFSSIGAGLFGSKCGNPKLIKKLLSYGADLFIQDNRGRTALGWAIESNKQSKKKTNDEVINLLEGEMLKEAALREFKKHFYYEFDHKGNFHSSPKN